MLGSRQVPAGALEPRSSAAPGRTSAWADLVLRLAFLALLLALWKLAHWVVVEHTGWWSGALFPAPERVGRWLWDGFGLSYLTGGYRPPPGLPAPDSFLEALGQADYPLAVLSTVGRLAQGYALALALGLPLGLLIARSSLLEKTLGWVAVSLQGLPSICWIPLALLWFGRGGGAGPILFVTVMGALFATAITVADGVRNVPPILSQAGRTLGARGARLYLEVLLPAALPAVVSGLKVGWAFAWRSLMAGEIVVYAGGLGFLIHRDREFGDTPGVMASILVVLLLGSTIQSLVFGPIERRVRRLWGLSGTNA
jgi:NitT/TauT family transport system permease protein